MSAIAEAVEAYRRQVAWKAAGRPPTKCPGPSAGDILDAEIANRGITGRSMKDRTWCQLAYQVFEIAEGKERFQPPRM